MLAVALSLGPLGTYLRGNPGSERSAAVVGSITLAMGGMMLTRESPHRLWGSLIFYSPAVALLRTAPAALVSTVAPEELRGRALGALDAIGSCARVAVPLITGILTEIFGVTGPFFTQAIVSLMGAVVLFQLSTTDKYTGKPE